MIAYLLKVAFIQAVLIVFYAFGLRKLKQFKINRVYLLAILLIAAVLPLIHISAPTQESSLSIASSLIREPILSDYQIWERIESNHYISIDWIALGYLLISAVHAIRFLFLLWSILKFKKKEVIQTENYQKNIHLSSYNESFSLFNQIFMPNALVGSEEFDKVLLHEQQHVRLRHTWDRIWTEVFIVLLWFNPFIYLQRKYLIENHEFEADQASLNHLEDHLDYQLLLLNMASGSLKIQWISGFAMSNTKRRIQMMNQFSTKNTKWKNLLMIPLIGLLITQFSFDWKVADSSLDKFDLSRSLTAISLGTELDIHNYIRQVKDEIPSIFPVKVEDAEVKVSSGSGKRKDPWDGKVKYHIAIDIAAPIGTSIIATGNGVILKVQDKPGGFGKMIILKHNEEYQTRYAHMDDFNVKEGDQVTRGDVIGYVGNSGKSRGSHLHYEVWKNDKRVNPEDYISDYKVK